MRAAGLAALWLLALGAAAAWAQADCDAAPPVPSMTAASKAAAKARAENGFPKQDKPVEENCTCDELEHYLTTDVERKERCYRQAYDVGRTGTPLGTQDAVNTFVETCMGWRAGSAESQGKAGDATPEQRQSAYEKCRKAHCQWICDYSVNCVHERYHDWFKKNAQDSDLKLIVDMIDQGSFNPLGRDVSINEVGAHMAEAKFLRDQLARARKNGTCEGIRGSVGKDERDKNFREAWDRSKQYVDSLAGAP